MLMAGRRKRVFTEAEAAKQRYEQVAKGSYVPDISWPAMARINVDKYEKAVKLKRRLM